MDYNLVLGMKVKTCVNSPYLNNNGWGKVGSEFPRIYVWIVTRSKELNVTTALPQTVMTNGIRKVQKGVNIFDK